MVYITGSPYQLLYEISLSFLNVFNISRGYIMFTYHQRPDRLVILAVSIHIVFEAYLNKFEEVEKTTPSVDLKLRDIHCFYTGSQA